MKYAAVTVAIAGVAVADSSLSIAWEPVDPTTSSTTWTTWDPKPTSSSTTWTTWDPKPTTTTTLVWEPVDPTSSSTTWTTWDPKPTTTTSTLVWEAYTTTTTTKPTECTYTTVVPTSKCDDKGHCWPDKYTSTILAESCTWTDWDPKPTTTTTTTTTTLAWEAFSSTTTTTQCSYVTVVPTHKCAPNKGCWDEKVTTTLYADTCTWAPWSTTSSSTKCSYVTAVPTTYCVPGSKDKCWSDSVTTTMYADTCTWAAWSTSTPVVPTTSAKCSYVTEIATSKCAPGHDDWCYPYKTTSTIYADTCTWEPITETSTYAWEPVTETSTATWSAVYESTETVESTVTETSTWATWETAVVTSVVTPGWSADGWFGPAWPTAKSGECVHNVVTSYGYPIWKPTPEASTTTETATWSAYTSVATGGHAEIKPNGKKWSMTYSPYTEKGKCKAQTVIEADIAKIASMGFTSVRVYSTDCDTLKFVGEACKAHGMTIILGVFIDKTGVKGAAKQVNDIVAWAQWEIVELIVVGNEAVFQGFCKPEELAAFIKSCKDTFSKAGYSGPCTTTEPLDQWQKHGDQFCGAVDVVAANLYAFFNSDCPAENAGSFIAAEIKILEGICSEKKETYVMECGWPSEGSCNGAACPGVEHQKTAILAIEEECGEQIVFFSFEDEVWKQPGQFGVEQHWGCSDVFGNGASTTTWANVPVSVTKTSTTTTAWATWGAM